MQSAHLINEECPICGESLLSNDHEKWCENTLCNYRAIEIPLARKKELDKIAQLVHDRIQHLKDNTKERIDHEENNSNIVDSGIIRLRPTIQKNSG